MKPFRIVITGTIPAAAADKLERVAAGAHHLVDDGLADIAVRLSFDGASWDVPAPARLVERDLAPGEKLEDAFAAVVLLDDQGRAVEIVDGYHQSGRL